MLPYIVGGAVGGTAATVAAVRYMFPWIKYDVEMIVKGAKIMKKETGLANTGKVFVDLFEDQVKEIPNKPFVIFEVE